MSTFLAAGEVGPTTDGNMGPTGILVDECLIVSIAHAMQLSVFAAV
jgi:hypothetical protein